MAEPGEEIPVIDLTSCHGRRDAESEAVVRSVARACEEIGFFIVTGHGVPEATIEEMATASRAFFDLPAAVKTKIGESGPLPGGLMYFPFKAESLGATAGAAALGDLKESLDFGPGFGGDPWPDRPLGLERVWRAYFAALSDLAALLRRLFARAVGLPEDHFEPLFDRHHSALRVLNYPPPAEPPKPGQIRAGAHRDYGLLTILRSQARPGGLQVQSRAGRWIDVPGVPGAFVVNIGDAMMRWTNDRWVSTLHRVVNPPEDARGPTRRQSIAFFHAPNAEAVIDCLPAFRGPGQPAKYPPITYAEHADLRFRQAHGKTAPPPSAGVRA